MRVCVRAGLRGSERAKVKSLEDRKLATPEDLRKRLLEALETNISMSVCVTVEHLKDFVLNVTYF